jgi:hypothetical protein
MRALSITNEHLIKFEDIANRQLVKRLRDSANGAKGDKHGTLLKISMVLSELFPTEWASAMPPVKDKLIAGFKRRMTEARRINGTCVTSVQQRAFDNDIIANPPKNFAEAQEYVASNRKHVGVYVTINRDGLIPVAARKLAMLKANGVVKHANYCFKTWDSNGLLGLKAKAGTELSNTAFSLLLEENREERAAALLTA